MNNTRSHAKRQPKAITNDANAPAKTELVLGGRVMLLVDGVPVAAVWEIKISVPVAAYALKKKQPSL